MLLSGPQNILERKKQLRQYHIKQLIITVFLLGFVHTCFLFNELYTAITDPYIMPWGNTKENPWFYASPALYVTSFIACLAGYIPALILMVLGQLREKKKLTITGAVIIIAVLFFSFGSIGLDAWLNGKIWP